MNGKLGCVVFVWQACGLSKEERMVRRSEFVDLLACWADERPRRLSLSLLAVWRWRKSFWLQRNQRKAVKLETCTPFNLTWSLKTCFSLACSHAHYEPSHLTVTWYHDITSIALIHEIVSTKWPYSINIVFGCAILVCLLGKHIST